MKRFTQKINKSTNDENVTCEIHEKKCDFYCTNCNVFLCGDCILEYITKGNPHQNHNVIKVEEMIKEKGIISLQNLQTLLSQITFSIKKYESIKGKIESNFDESMISMHSAFRNIQEHIRTKEKSFENVSQNIAQKNEIKMEEIQILVDDSEEILKSTDPQIASSALCVIDKIKKIVSEKMDPIVFPKISFTNELIPEYSSFQIKIPKFIESFKSKTYKTTYTQPIDIFHGQWRTKIYGSQKGDDSHANLAVFVELLKGYGTPILIDYKVQIHHPEKDSIISRTFKSEFNVMDSWGWTKFAVVDTIINEGYVNANDELVLEICLRPSSYAEYCKIYSQILKKTQSKYRSLKKKYKSKGQKRSLHEEEESNSKTSDDAE